MALFLSIGHLIICQAPRAGKMTQIASRSDWLPQWARWSLHSGQTTGHSRDLCTSRDFRSLSRFITKFPQSTSFTRAITVLSPIILPLQTFFSRVLLLRQQANDNNYSDKKHKSSCFATYEQENSLFIVVEKVSLLKTIYERDAHFRAVFKVKTLAVLSWVFCFRLIPAK